MVEVLETTSGVYEDVETNGPRERSGRRARVVKDLEEITIFHVLHDEKRLIDDGDSNETDQVLVGKATHEDTLLLELCKESGQLFTVQK